MRCVNTAVAQCTDCSPWVQLCGEELFNLSVFNCFCHSKLSFYCVSSSTWTSSTKSLQPLWPEFLGCCDVSMCLAEQRTSRHTLGCVSFWCNMFYTFLRFDFRIFPRPTCNELKLYLVIDIYSSNLVLHSSIASASLILISDYMSFITNN